MPPIQMKAGLKFCCFLSLFNLVILSESPFLARLALAETTPTLAPTETRETLETSPTGEIITHPPLETQENSSAPEIPPTPPPETESEPANFTVFIIGFNVGRRNVNSGVLVRGEVGETEAIDFENWLVPYDAVLQALKFTSSVISDQEVELRSPYKITRLDLNQLRSDPELGLAFSVGEIQEIFGIKAEFDWREYAIVFQVPEVENSRRNNPEDRPVILDGLPEVSAPNFTLSMVEQQINTTGSEGSDLRNQGRFSAVGTVFDNSWYLRVNQGDLSDRQTWQLSEFQILRQTDNRDYYLGSQPTFWRNQSGGDFWGFTSIQRRGFSPFSNSGSRGANPSQRLQPEQVTATVTGRAEPGTLVRLVRDLNSREVVAEELVDSSGTYRFDNIPVGRQAGRNYYILLYPDGSLAAEPQVEEARFTTLPEQLAPGTSALVISGGWERRLGRNDFFGEFTQFNAGIAQRWGVTEDLTVGLGGVYDSSINALAEVFYKPRGTPIRIGVSGLIGEDIDVNANLVWDASPNFYASLSSDLERTRYTVDWQVLPQLRFVSSGSLDEAANFGLQYFSGGDNHSTLARVNIDTDGRLSWNLNQRLGNFYLSQSGNDTSTASQLSYRFNSYQSLVVNYNTRNSSDRDSLLAAYWRYRSPTRNQFGESLWQVELGYGIGSQGNGVYASAGTAILAGMLLEARYEGVSLSSNESRLRLQLVSSLGFQGGMSPGDRRLDRLRTEGGLLVQPFYDVNSNGKRDANEEIYRDESEFMMLNNELVKSRQIDLKGDRLLVRLPPGNYRLDLDPAGFPPDFQPSVNTFAVEVVEGSYTPILIPLQASYTVAGVITNAAGEPIPGAELKPFLAMEILRVYRLQMVRGFIISNSCSREPTS